MIAFHPCQHEGQDALHGNQMRVMNPALKPEPHWRCAVCGKAGPAIGDKAKDNKATGR